MAPQEEEPAAKRVQTAEKKPSKTKVPSKPDAVVPPDKQTQNAKKGQGLSLAQIGAQVHVLEARIEKYSHPDRTLHTSPTPLLMTKHVTSRVEDLPRPALQNIDSNTRLRGRHQYSLPVPRSYGRGDFDQGFDLPYSRRNRLQQLRQPARLHHYHSWPAHYQTQRQLQRFKNDNHGKGADGRHISSCELHIIQGCPKLYIDKSSQALLRAMADFTTPTQRRGAWIDLPKPDQDPTPKLPAFSGDNISEYQIPSHHLAPPIGLGIDLGARFQRPNPLISAQRKRPDSHYIQSSFFPSTTDPYATYLPQPYHNMLQNRIRGYNLDPGGKWDIDLYTPVFVYDSLMLPGTVATTVNKTDALPFYSKLTPAFLPGYRILPAKGSHQPLLLPSSPPTTNTASSTSASSNSQSYVQGALLLAQDPKSRRRIYEHYLALDPTSSKQTVEVQTDIVVGVEDPDKVPRMRWRLRTVFLKAVVMVSADFGRAEQRKGTWELGKFLGGGFDDGEGKQGGGSTGGIGAGGTEVVSSTGDGSAAVVGGKLAPTSDAGSGSGSMRAKRATVETAPPTPVAAWAQPIPWAGGGSAKPNVEGEGERNKAAPRSNAASEQNNGSKGAGFTGW